jgi:hypothetical protein
MLSAKPAKKASRLKLLPQLVAIVCAPDALSVFEETPFSPSRNSGKHHWITGHLSLIYIAF